MPKIPTYNTQGRITAEGPGVKTGIQVSPRSTIAAALVPAANELTNYAIKRRNTEEQLIADKSILELKSESDKIIYSQKDNISEEDSINNYKKKFTPLVQEKLLSTKNRRVKQLIQSGINIDNSENIYFLKKNSFEALEKNSLTNVNNKITSILSKYSSVSDTAAGFAIKAKYRNQTENIIKKYATDFNLPDNVLQNHLKAAKANFLIADMNQLVGFINGSEQIQKLDSSLNGNEFLNNSDFGEAIFNAYNNEISDLTIKGDPNADYPRALELIDNLKNFQRSDGYKVDTGVLSVKINTLQEKILVEQLQHESLIRRGQSNKLFFDYSKDLQKALTESIADPYSDPVLQDRIAAAEIESEYNEKIKKYLSINSDASLETKKEFARSLVYSLKNIYEDRNIATLESNILNKSSFDIESEYQRVVNDMLLLSENKLDETTLEQYERLAKINGYTIKGKDEDGNTVSKGDVKSFINEYLPVLQNQFTIITQG